MEIKSLVLIFSFICFALAVLVLFAAKHYMVKIYYYFNEDTGHYNDFKQWSYANKILDRYKRGVEEYKEIEEEIEGFSFFKKIMTYGFILSGLLLLIYSMIPFKS